MGKPIAEFTNTELRNYVDNHKRRGLSCGQEIIRECFRRGKANWIGTDPHLWDSTRCLTEILPPFQAIASGVQNRRTSGSTNGGLTRIGKDDERRRFVDTYSAIKTDRINAVMACAVIRASDDPQLELLDDNDKIDGRGRIIAVYNLNQINAALGKWREIADLATLSESWPQ